VHADESVNASAADDADGKTGYQSSADACGHVWYFWWKQKCLYLHIPHLQRRASVVMAAMVTVLLYNQGMTYEYACELLFSL